MRNKLLSPQLWLYQHKVGETLCGIPIKSRDYLTQSELFRYQKFRSSKRKKQYLLSRLMIRTALSEVFDKPLNYWNIEEKQHSAPLVLNSPIPVKLSLSHSQDIVALAIATHPIGIDIEAKVVRQFEDAAKLFMSLAELKEFEKSPSMDHFYRIWCMKEAVYKAIFYQNNALRLMDINTHSIFNTAQQNFFELFNEQYQFTFYSTQPLHSVCCRVFGDHELFWEENHLKDTVSIQWKKVES